MPQFTVTVLRTYRDYETTEIRIEAATPEAALARAMRIEHDQGFDDWHEYDGSADPDSYRWEVFAAADSDRRHCLLFGAGAVDGEDDQCAPS